MPDTTTVLEARAQRIANAMLREGATVTEAADFLTTAQAGIDAATEEKAA